MKVLIILTVFITGLIITVNCATYKNVIFMHGIFAGPSEDIELIAWIQKAHPGTNVTAINMFDNYKSLTPIWDQVHKIMPDVQKVMNSSPQGTILICFSQGGLVCRGLLSVLNHNVENFIALSSPLMGQYGDTRYLKYFFPNYVKSEIYKYFYSTGGQKWSVANYWNDPHHQQLYLKYSNFLAILNNQTFNPKSQEYKQNFLKLKNLVMIGGPDDEVITPWQSSHMDFYNANETVVNMRQQPWYINDWFGLKTLDNRKAIHIFTEPGVQHIHWYRTKAVFDKYILPFLT
ncbi:lysosomal thioesterase PPT2-A [Patella vulgata]|uniref:lysosomal thioesterase PPT2-A n=1 Tax=Patella vulgata TaxID=6465 RepID=UPI00217F7BDC|nr:lysosomal thioesterase PPT2-A [Patella vulgata]